MEKKQKPQQLIKPYNIIGDSEPKAIVCQTLKNWLTLTICIEIFCNVGCLALILDKNRSISAADRDF